MSLIEQAIVDAKALKEAALKNAEDAVINKYSAEVKKTLDMMLEQEDVLGLGDELGGEATEAPDDDFQEEIEDVQYAAENDISSLETNDLASQSLNTGETQVINLDLGALKEHIQKLRESSEEVEEINEEDEQELYEFVEEDEALEEEIEVSEEDLAEAIKEMLTVDMGATLSGWAGRSSEDKKHQMELEMAHRRSTELQQELEDLKKAQEELVFENKKLTSELSKYNKAIGELKESVNDINLSNARLLYTNRVLRDTSLNERQKNKIVEAISKSDSVAEARTIFNALQSTVQSTPKAGPQSLSEAIHRPSSLIRATRKESTEPTDIFAERMKKLAGIK